MAKECCVPQWFAWRHPTKDRSFLNFPNKYLKFLACLLGFYFSLHQFYLHAQSSPLDAAEELFSKGQNDLALKKFEEVAKNPFGTSRDLSFARCRIGVIESINGDFETSRKNLENSLSSGALIKKHVSLCFYALLQIYVIQEANIEARTLLKKYPDPIFTPIYLARIWALGAEVGRRLQDSRTEVVYLQKLLALLEGQKLREVDLKILGDRKVTLAEVKSRLGVENKSISEEPVKHSEKKQPQTTASPAAVASNHISSSVFSSASNSDDWDAIKALSSGDSKTAAPLFAKIKSLNSFGISIPIEKINARLQSLNSDKPRMMRVGILLPWGPQFTKYKHRILRAVSAFSGSPAAQDVSFSYFIRGIGSDVGAAEQGALSLILEEKVHIILGPISGHQTMGALNSAQLFGVPLFALGPVSFSPEIFTKNIVRMGVLAKSQAHLLVPHLQNDLGFKNVAILAANDAYGAEMAGAFNAVCQESNFAVEQMRYYDVNQQVFQDTVQSVLGAQDFESRKDEFDASAKILRKKAESEKRKFDPREVKLSAKIRFDAIFIPESLPKMKYIASTMAFNEARNIRYIGDRTWSDGLGKVSIVDQFLNGARVPILSSGSFLSYLQTELETYEGSLDLERQTFDALILVRQAQYRASGNNSQKMIAALHSSDFSAEGSSVYGPVDSQGEPKAKMTLSNYKNGKLVQQLLNWKTPKNKASDESENSVE